MSDKLQLLPITANDIGTTTTSECRISISKLLLIGYAHPLLTVVYIIIKTMISDFEGSTFTHCRVLNIVPSMSTVIRAQQSFWVVSTWIHLPFRLLTAWFYWHHYRRRLPRPARHLGWLAVGLLVQNSLSSVPLAQLGHITGTVPIHVMTALSVWLSGTGYVGISYLCSRRYRCEALEPHEKLSLLLKRKLFFTCFGMMLLMWPMYVLHTEMCIPLAYSVFSLCEYILTCSIMGFIGISYLDFYTVYLRHSAQLGFYFTEI